ncbi:hypothetical protein UCDDS831_g03187 [Diplodia seriata]|uniref:Uncharacterized protein n=1 Tax=Diplodia seriata TaxID=420778 RepID=A0A0G2EJQ8_9PEZI|nr:hypothetical protein UCDDS831_g03187 [Diplodia seriata]
MGKHSNFLSKTLKTIPYPKKGSDRRLGKDNKLSQLEEELAQHKRQEQISSKQLADARAESALWQKKYDQLHAMVGRHVCEQQQPPKDPQPPIPQRRSTTKTLSSHHPPLPATPEEDDHHPSAPSPPAIAAAVAVADHHPAKSTTHSPALTLTLPAPSSHHHKSPHDNDSPLSTTTTLCTPPSPSPNPNHPHGKERYTYTPSPRLATIPLLFALAALTRLAQREKPVYHPTGYFDAAGAGVGGSGIVLKLLAANIILVAVLGEGARGEEKEEEEEF